MRTNIDIDDDLVKQAMHIAGLTTKKEVVNRALLEFVQRHTRKDLAELKGKIKFADNYNYKAKREGR